MMILDVIFSSQLEELSSLSLLLSVPDNLEPSVSIFCHIRPSQASPVLLVNSCEERVIEG